MLWYVVVDSITVVCCGGQLPEAVHGDLISGRVGGVVILSGHEGNMLELLAL